MKKAMSSCNARLSILVALIFIVGESAGVGTKFVTLVLGHVAPPILENGSIFVMSPLFISALGLVVSDAALVM